MICKRDMSQRCKLFSFSFFMYISHVSPLHNQSRYNPPRMVPSQIRAASLLTQCSQVCLSGRRGNASLRLPRCDNTSLNAPVKIRHRDCVLAIFFVISRKPPDLPVQLCQCKLYTSMILAIPHSSLLDTVHLGLSHICAWVSSPGSQHAISPIKAPMYQGTKVSRT